MTTTNGLPRRAFIRVGLAVATAGGLSACTGSGTDGGSTTSQAGPSRDADTAASTTDPGSEASSTTSSTPDPDATIVAAAVVNRLQIFGEPADIDELDDAGEPEQVLDRSDRVTGQLILLALAVGTAWTQVQLPVRPNGSTGWVRSSEISLSSHSYRIDIDLGGHEIVVTNAGNEVLRSPIGVGRADRPTPGGDYFITELLQPPDPDGLYGPYAYGLSGYSDVLMDFRGGEGVIGIHGTNEPDLVGTDVSSGCIRLPNAEITRLVDAVGLPLGTPVTIAS
ncbi:MAG: L,D-transpeptidase [Ornithinimicrobium sp.]